MKTPAVGSCERHVFVKLGPAEALAECMWIGPDRQVHEAVMSHIFAAFDAHSNPKWHEPMAVLFPYTFQRMESSERYIALNRRYKPLGVAGREFIDYALWPVQYEMNVTPEIVAWLESTFPYDVRSQQHPPHLYLWNDACAPYAGKRFYNGYRKRLAELLLRTDAKIVGAGSC
jgi:hypothetical protein